MMLGTDTRKPVVIIEKIVAVQVLRIHCECKLARARAEGRFVDE